MRFENIFFAGIGTAELDHVDTADAVAQGWYTAEARERSELLSVSVAGTTPAPDLAVEAACFAVEGSGHAPEDFCAVFHTNVHPQGPDGWSAQHYINHRTINQPVTSIEIRNGCTGFFSNLLLSASYLQATEDRTAALLTCADNFGTPAVNRWNASSLFVLADGGGAVVLSRRGGFARLLSVGAASDPELEIRHRGTEALFPPAMTVGGTLNFDERMGAIQQQENDGTLGPLGDFGSVVNAAAEIAFADAGIGLDDISRVVHDGFARWALRDIFLDPLGIDEKRGIWEFTRRLGHAGPLDQIRGLEYVWRSREAEPGEKVLLLSGGPGMEAACAIVEIVEAP